MSNGTSKQKGTESRGIDNRGTTHNSLTNQKKRWKTLRLPGNQQETDENIFRLVASLKQRNPRLQSITSGRIKGNILSFGGKQFALDGISGISKGSTISGTLGAGVFLFKPLPKKSVSAISLLMGDPYEVWLINSSGKQQRTNIQLTILNLGVISEGIFIYSPRILYAGSFKIVARRPAANLKPLIQRISTELDWRVLGSPINPSIMAINIMAAIDDAKLSKKEFNSLIKQLKEKGLLGRFFNLVHIPQFRKYLRTNCLTWNYIFSNWEPNFNDTARLLAGYVSGVGQNIYEAAKLVYIMVGAIFSEELAKQRQQFVDAIRKFFSHPWTNTIKGIKKLYKLFKDALWKLDFFEAGRILGNVVIVVLTLPSAIKALPKAAKFLAKSATHLAKLTVAQLRRLGITANELRQFLLQPSRQLVTPKGITLMASGDNIGVFSLTGKALGRISQQYIDDVINKLDDLKQGKQSKKPAKVPHVNPSLADIRKVVREALEELQKMKVKPKSRHEIGTFLHKAVERQLLKLSLPKGWKVFVERPLKEIMRLSKKTSEMKVSEFLSKNPHIEEIFSKLSTSVKNQKVGNMQPDLIIKAPDGSYIVWDLTSQPIQSHISKTSLYAHILAQDNILAHIGETYWLDPNKWGWMKAFSD